MSMGTLQGRPRLRGHRGGPRGLANRPPESAQVAATLQSRKGVKSTLQSPPQAREGVPQAATWNTLAHGQETNSLHSAGSGLDGGAGGQLQ